MAGLSPARTAPLAALAVALSTVGCSEGVGTDDDRAGGGGSGGSGPGGGSPAVGLPDAGPVAGQAPVEPVGPDVDAEATRFFFAYDESASTAARDLTLSALADGRRPSPDLGRPYEFLNAEAFGPFDARPVGDFDVSMTLRRSASGDVPLPGALDTSDHGALYALGVNLAGPTLPLAERPNLVLTLLVDVSGSMDSAYASETRTDASTLLDVVKHGLARIGPSLKEGDVLNLVSFSTTADVLLEGASPESGELQAVVGSLVTESTTNIGLGVERAYEVANRTYDPDKANRVVILTDAMVNTGELDPARIAEATVIGDLEGILFSGVGIGAGFDDSVLDPLTDAGRGTYSAMITPNDAERLFTTGFARFVAPAATDVRFSLSYPQALDQLRSFAEAVSTVEDEVRSVNFSYDSDQFFLELFGGPDALDPDATIALGVDYTDPAGERRELTLARTVGELLGNPTDELDAALAVTTLAELVAGRLDCATVRGSALYEAPVQNATYALYRRNIDRFCDL